MSNKSDQKVVSLPNLQIWSILQHLNLYQMYYDTKLVYHNLIPLVTEIHLSSLANHPLGWLAMFEYCIFHYNSQHALNLMINNNNNNNNNNKLIGNEPQISERGSQTFSIRNLWTSLGIIARYRLLIWCQAVCIGSQITFPNLRARPVLSP